MNVSVSERLHEIARAERAERMLAATHQLLVTSRAEAGKAEARGDSP